MFQIQLNYLFSLFLCYITSHYLMMFSVVDLAKEYYTSGDPEKALALVSRERERERERERKRYREIEIGRER